MRAGAIHTGAQKKKAEQHKEELIPLTVPEARVLLWQLVWHKLPPAEFVLDWGHWQRPHHSAALPLCAFHRSTDRGNRPQ